MSLGFGALFIYILLTAVFYIWYLSTRSKLRTKVFQNLFFLNMVYGVIIVLPIPLFFLRHFGINNSNLNICLVVMALGIIIHHLTLLKINKTKKYSKNLDFFHIPVSHLMLGIPFILTGIFGLLSFLSTRFNGRRYAYGFILVR